MATFLQLMIIGTWGAVLLIQTRRLLRLTMVPVAVGNGRILRQRARRIWALLGRDEFWQKACGDIARSLEITLMVVVLSWRL